jgi:hypothetical protein
MTLLHPPYETDQTSETVRLWPCVAVLVICMAAVVVLASWPRIGLPVAIVFPPWWSLDQINAQITQAGGALIDFGAVKGVVVGISPDPDFAQHLYANGALWAMDGSFAASLCVVPTG